MRRVIRLRLFLLVGIGLTLFIGLAGLSLRLVLAQAPNEFTRVTAATDSNRDSESPHLSADGTRLVFHTDADFLDQGISDNQFEIWLYDTETIAYTRVTTASARNRDSFDPVLSADGTTLAFDGDSDLLDQGVANNQSEIWLYDVDAEELARITTASEPTRASFSPSLNAGGTKIAFSSDSDFLEQGIAPGQAEIWLYDTGAMTYTRITTASHTNRASVAPRLSADGTTITFLSDSDFFIQRIRPGQFEVWQYDVETGELARVTIASATNRTSESVDLNAGGTVLAFDSDSDFLNQGNSRLQYEVWLYSQP